MKTELDELTKKKINPTDRLTKQYITVYIVRINKSIEILFTSLFHPECVDRYCHWLFFSFGESYHVQIRASPAKIRFIFASIPRSMLYVFLHKSCRRAPTLFLAMAKYFR